MAKALDPCRPRGAADHSVVDAIAAHDPESSVVRGDMSLAQLTAYCSSNAEMAYRIDDAMFQHRVDHRSGRVIPSLSTERSPRTTTAVTPKRTNTGSGRGDELVGAVATPFVNLPHVVAGLYKSIFRRDSPENQFATALVVDPIKNLVAAAQRPGDALSNAYEAGKTASVAGMWKGLVEGMVDPPNEFLRALGDKEATDAELAMAFIGMVGSIGLGGGGPKAAKLAGVAGGSNAQRLASRSKLFSGDARKHLGRGVLRSGLVQVDEAGDIVSSQLRFLRTADIAEADLGYPGGLRARNASFKVVPVKSVSNVVLVSDVRNGGRGLVRMGELEDGTPVALKTYYSNYGAKFDEATIRTDVDDMKFDSDLGIGPRFHGTFIDDRGKTNIVTDIVRGDFPAAVPQHITDQTFVDLETIFERLDQAGVKEIVDFQPLIDEHGRMLVIDPGEARKIGEKPPVAVNSENGSATRERASLMLLADPAVAQVYAAELKKTNRDVHDGLRQYYAARQLPFPGE